MDITAEDTTWLEETFVVRPGVTSYFTHAAELIQPLREAVPLIRKAYPTEMLFLEQELSADWPSSEPDPSPIIIVDKGFVINPNTLPPHHAFLDAPEIEAESQRLWGILGDDGYGRADFFFRREDEDLASVHFCPYCADDFVGTIYDRYQDMTEAERKAAEEQERLEVKEMFIARMQAAGYTVTDLTEGGDVELDTGSSGKPIDALSAALEDFDLWMGMRYNKPKEEDE